MASTLTVDNIVGATSSSNIHIPGHVVQVVNLPSTTLTRAATTSTSYVASNIQNTITPKFANSKLIVRCATTGNNNTNSAEHMVYTYFRSINGGSYSNLRPSSPDWGIGQVYSAASRVQVPLIAEIVDEPNTTDPVTYKIYFKSYNGNSVEIPATTVENLEMTIMEIAQ
jgi:hypothetical protein